MSENAAKGSGKPYRLRLPATSANLGPGFDALGLAMALYLTIDARVADAFHIEATGRDADQCARLEDNLILTTYVDVLAVAGVLAPRLHLQIHNEIPLGMGCGSSASALLAGVFLANHFGNLGWGGQQILEDACLREGHPDNVAACYLGGMTTSSISEKSLLTATCGENITWGLNLALPSVSFATEKARALLPATYSREDVVANIQSTALLVAAFAQGRGDLLRIAMQDRIHQPYRMKACPLLPLLLPVADDPAILTPAILSQKILGVALSGAGPSVLIITQDAKPSGLPAIIRQAAGDPSLEVLQTTISTGVLEG
ncbi:homoserine kinase [Tunturibacter empetritectus]|uniref:Homoserine kinase n=1 Tax=Tunturiibacter lichenicola TaxID=2051959 RepID=A0A7W8N2F6_9BACT|nr:homoserine kinase [Edaphobacter lichenicola]MBB5343024.1 homoserine kinase [Edaphobacter lichenicola]